MSCQISEKADSLKALGSVACFLRNCTFFLINDRGVRYLWAYMVVFLTAIILSVQHWPTDAYLVVLATLGYGAALGGYGARRFRQKPMMRRMLGKQWISAHIVGMIGSYVVLWTAFYVDNAHLFPGLKELPTLTFWVLPTVIALPFLMVSLSRFAPKSATTARRESALKGECS